METRWNMATASTTIERPKPLRDQVYDRIIGLILDMSVKPGDSLTEPMLIKRLGVSRTPIREALLRLEAEGVLTSQLSRGFRLKPLDRTEAEEIFPILASLEMLAIREMPDAIRPSTLKRLRTTVTRLGSTEDPIERWRLSDEFHRLLAAESGNRRLDEMARQIRVMIGRYELAFMLEVSPRHRDADERHDRIVDALEKNERLQAARLDREHWDEEAQQITHWLR